MLTGPPPTCAESDVAELKVCERGAKPYPGLITCRNELTTIDISKKEFRQKYIVLLET